MKDQSKTKQALVQELASLRRRVADLEKMEADKDVIIHRDAEKALSESEELYRTLVETSPDAILMYALDGTILAVNNQLVVRYGAASAAEFHAERKEIDLVILDMTMPGLSGGETFDRLREIGPEIRVLLSSGYSVDGQAQQILERGYNGFLQKPFQLGRLSQKVRNVLSEEGP
jgi:CheY-like chemotaxis protein